MVRLKVLSGKKAGTTRVARRFPLRIGRAANTDLQLEESGVWDQHLRLDFVPDEGIVLRTEPNALATINGQVVEEAVLRNADAIGIGACALQFELSETHQMGLRFREVLTWACIGAVCFGQVGLIYWLLR